MVDYNLPPGECPYCGDAGSDCSTECECPCHDDYRPRHGDVVEDVPH